MKLFNYDKNTCTDAIVRMRGSGGIVPKKVTGKYIYTVDSINKINSIQRGTNILLIHDYNSANDANLLQSQLLSLQNEPGFLSFRQNIGYPQELDMNIYDDKNNPNGKIIIKSVKQKIDTLGEDLQYYTTFVPYDGSDIKITKYGVVILFTKIIPFYDVLTDQTIDVSEYDSMLGFNLQNYIANGGNIIFSNNVWQNTQIPNFYYSNTPFIYKNNYTYTPPIKLNKINFIQTRSPILKGCSPDISMFLRQKILEVVYVTPGAELIATINYNNKDIPFLANYTSVGGSRSVAINAYIGAVSNDRSNNLELAKIVYNSIYWCFKINI
jgi:hypothetical protein